MPSRTPSPILLTLLSLTPHFWCSRPPRPPRHQSQLLVLASSKAAEAYPEVDESYRELLRSRAASAAKAPQPQVTSEELDTLEPLFRNADTNSDGVIDYEEWARVLRVANLLAP